MVDSKREQMMGSGNTSHKESICLFLMGCFSMTQINLIGYIGISELVMFFVAPFVFIHNYQRIQRQGFLPVLMLGFAWMAGATLSDYVNRSHVELLLRGIATPYTVIATVICLHALLYKNVFNIKWFLFGLACSSIICIFVFQPGTAAYRGEADAMDAVLNYKLFWVTRAMLWLSLVIQIAYLRVPLGVSLGITGFLAYFSLVEGGRSAFLCVAVSFVIMLAGGRRVQSMKRIKRYFGLALIVGVLSLAAIRGIYHVAVTNGLMGEEELTKYEIQTKSGSGILHLLMAGRADFFVGLIAIRDKPLLGHGSWAIDVAGYQQRFLDKYGNAEDYERYVARYRSNDRTIPGHSHIVGFWLWHGIAGGLFWLYVLRVIYITIKNHLAVVPELYGYLALAIPLAVWNILFSPFGMRTSMCCLIVTCLIVHAIAKGRIQYFPEGWNNGPRFSYPDEVSS